MILSSRQAEDTVEQEPPSTPLNLYLALPQVDVPKRPPSWLARLLGLDLYSHVLLSKSARTEMNFAAAILVVVSSFEFIAWFFLFNAIFNSDLVKIGLPTIPAVLMATLFAAAVFWFERQFLTTDEDQRNRAWGAAVVRVIFILTAAFITAQPLELLFFRVPVQKRIHEEGIREEAVSKLAALLKEGKDVTKAAVNKTNRRNETYENVQSQIQIQAKQRGSVEAQLAIKEGELAAARSEASRARRERDYARTPEERRNADRALARAESRAAAASAEIGQLKASLAGIGSVLDVLNDRADKAQEEMDALEDTLQQSDTSRDRRLRHWIDQLKDSKPGKTVTENWKIAKPAESAGTASSIWDKSWTYKDPQYDFFEQIHVVWDLVNGRPPRWLNAPPALQKKLEEEYGFASLDQGRRGWQVHLFAAVVACHLIAIFIPFLVLTIKLFLMPKALREYYSRRHQAEAGDPDAQMGQMVDERVKGS
jgi:uncharacterized protein DUF4407